MSSTDPYEVLRLPRNFTLEQLRANYKRLALQLHPDKNIVSTEHASEIFKILTVSYKQLMHEYHARQSDRPFHELRSAAQQQQHEPPSPTRGGSGAESVEAQKARHRLTDDLFASGDGRFDASKFNQFFAENKVADPTQDTGYGEWLKSESPVDRPAMSGGQDGRRRPPKECKSLMLHVDALALGKSRLTFSEMGVDGVDDFSIPHVSRKGVGATDLRVAYSARDEDEAEDEAAAAVRREYKNVDELERDRAAISYSMNDADAHAYEQYKEWQATRESRQQSHIRHRDGHIQTNFERVQNLLRHR